MKAIRAIALITFAVIGAIQTAGFKATVSVALQAITGIAGVAAIIAVVFIAANGRRAWRNRRARLESSLSPRAIRN